MGNMDDSIFAAFPDCFGIGKPRARLRAAQELHIGKSQPASRAVLGGQEEQFSAADEALDGQQVGELGDVEAATAFIFNYCMGCFIKSNIPVAMLETFVRKD